MIKITINIYNKISIDKYDVFNKKNSLDLFITFKVLPNLSIETIKRAESDICHIVFRFEWLFWHIPISIFFKLNNE